MDWGVDINNKKQLRSWLKRKTVTQVMILSLIEVAEKKGKRNQAKSYRNSYYCFDLIYEKEGRLFGKYCKCRICTLCCAIRKADIINKYYPILRHWNHAHFLTLTIKSIPAKELDRYADGLHTVLRKIIAKHRKRNQRGKGPKLVGVRSFECNFNPKKRTYNPHFHIIVQTEEMAKILREEWMKIFPRKYVHPVAQSLRPVKNIERDLIEIIKYGSKIFTEPDLKLKSKRNVSRYVYISALDNILTMMSKRRIFDRFGFNCSTDAISTPISVEFNLKEWKYEPHVGDWVREATGDLLVNYDLPKQLISLLEHNLDLELD